MMIDGKYIQNNTQTLKQKNINQKTKIEIFNYACTNLCQKILKQKTAKKKEMNKIVNENVALGILPKRNNFFRKKN